MKHKINRMFSLASARTTFIPENERRNVLFLFPHDNVECYVGFDCPVICKNTNVGIRLAYLLHILRGSNTLDQLLYYMPDKTYLQSLSDDNMTLRGAYGPRLRYWVGSDQLQEAIEQNADIDEPDEFVKPQGVDQLREMYDDMKENGLEVTAFGIYDPSIDFEETNFVPTLLSGVFDVDWKDGFLGMTLYYSHVDIGGFFINDLFAFKVIQSLMATFLDVGMASMVVHVARMSGYTDEKHCTTISSEHVEVPGMTADEGWADIQELCLFERHMRNMVTSKSIASKQVSIESLSQSLEKSFISKMKYGFFKDIAYALLIYSISLHDEDKRMSSFVGELVDEKLEKYFRNDIIGWLKYGPV